MRKADPDPFSVEVTLRVRYAETDQMGWAHHAHYFVWFEVGRTTFCRRKGFTYAELEREADTYLPVLQAACRYRQGLRYDEEFVVRTWLKEFKKRTLRFSYRLVHPSGSPLYAERETTHLVIDRTGRPRSFPEPYRQMILKGTGG